MSNIHILNWNIHAGGYGAYGDPAPNPERLQAISETIKSTRLNLGVTAATLADANKWDEHFKGRPGELGLPGAAKHLGFKAAYFTRLHDPRLEANDGAGIGVLFATDEKVASCQPVEMGNRTGLRTILDVGKYGLQLAHVYFDDLSAETRNRHWYNLMGQLNRDIPTAIIGDLNELRASLNGAKLRHRVGDMAVRAAAHLLPASSYLGQSVRGMNQRRLLPLAQAYGFQDADPHKRPTAPSRLPLFGLDYVLHDGRVNASGFTVLNNPTIRKASNHLPSTVKLAA